MELIAGFALVGYLGHWYAAAILSGRPLVRTLFDAAALAWGTVGFAAAVVLGQMFGPDAYDFRADIIATLPFLFYLPVKEVCAKEDRGGAVIGLILCAFGLAATLTNGFLLQNAVTHADQLYKVADARFNVGETSITAGLMLALAVAAFAHQRGVAWGAIAVAGLLLGGLVITRSRGFWVSSAFGVVSMVVVTPSEGRKRLVGYLALGMGAVVVLSVVLLGDRLLLFALGALDRLVSIREAGQDISLLNRFAEAQAAWQRVRVNPVLGYGWGVQFSHYSVIGHGTRHWAFMHNGYLSVWYKMGLWGLTLLLSVWIGAMLRAARAARLRALRPVDRGLALGAGATIAAFTPVAASSNPFSVLDQVLIVTLVLALAHGMADRADRLRTAMAAASDLPPGTPTS